MFVCNLLSFSHIPLILILSIIPYATPLSFSLPNIGPQHQNRDIMTEGNGTYISNQGIQVTTDEIDTDRTSRVGRATYMKPLHLWDNATNELADFNTSFSFVIDSNGGQTYADGLTFFMAQNNSFYTGGGALGLPVNISTLNPIAPYVAVEFDTFWNGAVDPQDLNNASIRDHVGIDINSLVSVKYANWSSNITNGKENQAWISYNSTSKNFTVIFTGYRKNRVQQYGIYYIVDLRKELPEWVIFGFTASTGLFFEKNNVKSWYFNSSDLQVDVNKGPTGPPVEAPNPRKKEHKTGLVVGGSVGVLVLAGGLALVGFALWKKSRREKRDEGLSFDVCMDNEFETGSGPKKFSYDELACATKNFAEEEKLGEGGFGGVYRGLLKESDNGSYVAVKRVSKSSDQGIKEYSSEVKIIGQLRHRNLVKLIGWCHEKGELLLVYEFMENGSLDCHLFKEKSSLTWGVRYKIAQGLASALLYLHEEWEQCVVHRDIKSSNVMLDSSFNAKLGDFGLARLVDHEKGFHTTALAGTMGYMAPECVITGQASKESDVFSFGVVSLEISCGRKPMEFFAKGTPIRLVEWVWDLYGMGKLIEAADPKLYGDFNQQEIEHLMIVGLWCAHPDCNLRPSIKQAIQALNFDAPLPILPPKIPVATYFPASVNSAISSLSSAYGATVSESSQIQSSNFSYKTNSS